MVEANPPIEDGQGFGIKDLADMTDDQFEAMAAKLPKMTPEEQEADMQEWINHPLNCKEITPEMLERPEF
jgi:hypothetical protein